MTRRAVPSDSPRFADRRPARPVPRRSFAYTPRTTVPLVLLTRRSCALCPSKVWRSAVQVAVMSRPADPVSSSDKTVKEGLGQVRGAGPGIGPGRTSQGKAGSGGARPVPQQGPSTSCVRERASRAPERSLLGKPTTPTGCRESQAAHPSAAGRYVHPCRSVCDLPRGLVSYMQLVKIRQTRSVHTLQAVHTDVKFGFPLLEKEQSSG